MMFYGEEGNESCPLRRILAILAGDALMAWAFEYPLCALKSNVPAERICEQCILANSLGRSVFAADRFCPTPAWRRKRFPVQGCCRKTAVLVPPAWKAAPSLEGPTKQPQTLSYVRQSFGFGLSDGRRYSRCHVLGRRTGKNTRQRPLKQKTFVSLFGLEETRRLSHNETEKGINASVR